MNLKLVLLAVTGIALVMGESGDGLYALEEGFLVDDFSNDTDIDYIEGSAELVMEPYRNITDFPVCVTDDDCEQVSAEAGMNYRCFQYMCYPWSKGSSTFRSCKRRSDCQGLEEEEAGNGEDGDCYRYFSIDFPHCIL